MEPKRVKIFLASSFELKDDRVAFELELGRRNHSWIGKGLYLQLVIWEDFIDAMSKERLQSEYNKAIADCDLFVMLFFTKVGKYTSEEFETAFAQFQENERPLIYTYFKDSAITTGKIDRDDLMSLLDFQRKLDELGHFYTRYENTEGLLFHFSKQLDKLLDNGFFKNADVSEKTAEKRIVGAVGPAKKVASDRNQPVVSADSLAATKMQLKSKAGEMKQLFKEMLELISPASGVYNDLIQQRERYNGADKQYRMGLITYESASVTFNQVRVGMLSMIDELKVSDFKGATQPTAAENSGRKPQESSMSETERKGLLSQKELIEEKIAYFNQEMQLTSSPDTKFSLKKKLQELETTLAEVKTKLNGGA